jgi:UDP-N-acetylmuramyl pentapeptide phosphotransferase/UDP-N-acetylglucosamine-1-phosphate transferase
MNLIDGINGLAALISLNFFALISILFFEVKSISFAYLSLVIIGSLLAFLRFNFSRKRKIFMGDCGSLILGLMMVCFSLELMRTIGTHVTQRFSGNQLTLLLMALFSFPIFDLFRVIFIRLRMRKSIFQADRNHLHHYFIDRLGKTHLVASMSLFTIHLVLIVLTFLIVY